MKGKLSNIQRMKQAFVRIVGSSSEEDITRLMTWITVGVYKEWIDENMGVCGKGGWLAWITCVALTENRCK